MRYQGKIADWKDNRGYGFINPNGGGPRIFVHISAFNNRRRRPIEGEIVTYVTGANKQGKPQALKVAYLGESRESQRAKHVALPYPLALALLFLGGLTAAAYMAYLPHWVPALYCTASVLTFLAYWKDKAAAMTGEWRTEEYTLHAMSIAGGWPGAVFAHRFLRHKSVKREFRVVFWVTVVLNLGLLYLVLNGSIKAIQ